MPVILKTIPMLALISLSSMASLSNMYGNNDVIFISSFEIECSLTINTGDSFETSFSQLSAGDTLCLNDGIYQQAMDVPSNIKVRAINDGMAEIDGGGTLGEAWSGALLQMNGNNSSVRGLKVHHSGPFANACQISGENNTMQYMSCSHGGSHKHKIPLRIGGTGHVVEDSWFYGEGRYVVQCFIGDHSVFRRNVARWDSTAANEINEPNATFANYNCSNITWENNISLDYGVPETPMQFGGDFYSPHNLGIYPELNHDNHWYGNIVVNHAANTDNNRAFRADSNHSQTMLGGIVKDFYVRDAFVDFVIKFNYEFSISSCTKINVTNESINCTQEADILHAYYNGVKTDQLLWPWKNQVLIKRDMCAQDERQSDWCLSDLSLTDYILNP